MDQIDKEVEDLLVSCVIPEETPVKSEGSRLTMSNNELIDLLLERGKIDDIAHDYYLKIYGD